MYPNIPEDIYIELMAQGVTTEVIETLDDLVGSGVDLDEALKSLMDEIIESRQGDVSEYEAMPTYSPRKGASDGSLVILPPGSFVDFMPDGDPLGDDDEEEDEDKEDEEFDPEDEEEDWDGSDADCPSLFDGAMLFSEDAPPATAFTEEDGLHVVW